MNITPQNTHLPIQTSVNLQTDSLRRENQQREVITKPEPSSQSGAEKGPASDKERGRTPAQNNQQVDFTSLRKQAELANDVIGNSSHNSSGNSSGNGSGQDSAKHPEQEANKQNSDGSGESKPSQASSSHGQQSSAEELADIQIIRNLENRDKAVRSHESAHAAVGGSLTGAPSYSYEIGPNGKKYAVGGEVSVDLTPIAGDPTKTIVKMNQVQAAALAPANPSAQDVRVAASAASIILEAQAELINIGANNVEAKPPLGHLYRDKELLQSDESLENNDSSKAFDRQIAQTLSAQEVVVPSRPLAVDERAGRIAQFYSTINQAYEKSASYQFELTA
ncbi:putative metalloprotease CJM1_0395 family protein [Colwellia sp. C1TZA3]|uniref:putative metalloprotease CJM1_0395 family protein n=1 Tax=Colwellia sp. C1TZA3 TaxID=2508879 RepID=UPI0011B9ADEA|nr:putative metalloprotease CJM1_0395 family protein [Colwellia sp. C1TZA3]TWX71415.1 hypothetical protein ESZ39_09405 [Colwellia sp. C1TZA3]